MKNSVAELRSTTDTKKIVLKLDLHDDNQKTKALNTVSALSGIDSIAVDMKEKKLTVIGVVDPVTAVSKLRKCRLTTDIISVGPAKEPKKPAKKKEEGAKAEDGGKKERRKEGKKERRSQGGEEGKKEDGKKEGDKAKKEGGDKKKKDEKKAPVFMPYYNPPMTSYNAPMTTYYAQSHEESPMVLVPFLELMNSFMGSN